jgi:hypothetical protein
MNACRIAVPFLVLMFAAAIAGFTEEAAVAGKPQPIRITGAQLQRAAGADDVTFTVTISDPGEYEVVLEVGRGFTEGALLTLVMLPESGDAPRQASLSFKKEACG